MTARQKRLASKDRGGERGDTKSSNERQNLKFQPAKRRSTKGNRALLHRSVGVVGVVEGNMPVPAEVLGCLKVQNTGTENDERLEALRIGVDRGELIHRLCPLIGGLQLP